MILLFTALFACETKVDATNAETKNTTEEITEVVSVTEESEGTNSAKTTSSQSTVNQTSTKNTAASNLDKNSTDANEEASNKETTAD